MRIEYSYKPSIMSKCNLMGKYLFKSIELNARFIGGSIADFALVGEPCLYFSNTHYLLYAMYFTYMVVVYL